MDVTSAFDLLHWGKIRKLYLVSHSVTSLCANQQWWVPSLSGVYLLLFTYHCPRSKSWHYPICNTSEKFNLFGQSDCVLKRSTPQVTNITSFLFYWRHKIHTPFLCIMNIWCNYVISAWFKNAFGLKHTNNYLCCCHAPWLFYQTLELWQCCCDFYFSSWSGCCAILLRNWDKSAVVHRLCC